MSLSKFEKGYMYRHENCLDTDMLVAVEPKDEGDSVNLVVRYWNRHSHVFMPNQATTDTVNVKKEDFIYWSKL